MCIVRSLLVALFGLVVVGAAAASSVELRWTAPTTNVDQTPVQDLAGYIVSQGQKSQEYTTHHEVGLEPRLRLEDLAAGQTYYWAVRAIDRAHNASAFSTEVSLTLPPVVVEPPPEPPDVIEPPEPPDVPDPPGLAVVRITQPRAGDVVAPDAAVEIQAMGGTDVERVGLQVNGQSLCVARVEPFTCVWHVPSAVGRAYVLEAVVIDAHGEPVVSPPVLVTTVAP